MAEKRYDILKINKYKKLEKDADRSSIISAMGLGVISMAAIMGTSVLARGGTISGNKFIDVAYLGLIYVGDGVTLRLMVESLIEKIHYKGKREELEDIMDEMTREDKRGRSR